MTTTTNPTASQSLQMLLIGLTADLETSLATKEQLKAIAEKADAFAAQVKSGSPQNAVSPTWSAILPFLFLGVESESRESKHAAAVELTRMADLADQFDALRTGV